MARELFNSKDHRGEDLVFLFIGAGKAIMWDDLIEETEPVALSQGIGDNSDLYASYCSCLDRF